MGFSVPYDFNGAYAALVEKATGQSSQCRVVNHSLRPCSPALLTCRNSGGPKKKQTIAKRVEVTDEDGWTRVTTTNRDQQFPKHDIAAEEQEYQDTKEATPEEGSTLQSLQEEYAKVEKRWEESDACRVLTALITERALSDGDQIDRCIIFGSASFCGLRRGWISRKTAAMGQLAAFKSMHSTIEKATGRVVPAHAQDPAYNDIDIEFLQMLGVEAIQHPRGFELLTGKSLAYTPTAELHVELQTLYAKPAIRLGSKLDFYWRNDRGLACTNRVLQQRSNELEEIDKTDTSKDVLEQRGGVTGPFRGVEEECRCFEDFLQGRQEARVPQFELKDASPFRDQHLYWLEAREDEAE